jgi:hypothetical protein
MSARRIRKSLSNRKSEAMVGGTRMGQLAFPKARSNRDTSHDQRSGGPA